jgi:hypothetical protein
LRAHSPLCCSWCCTCEWHADEGKPKEETKEEAKDDDDKDEDKGEEEGV